MAFQKLSAFAQKVSDLADKPALTPTALKGQFDAAPNELKDYLNNLIDALKLTTSGDSGAKNIGASTITGLSGSDVQTLLGSLKTLADGKAQIETGGTKILEGLTGTITFPPNATTDYTVTLPQSMSAYTVTFTAGGDTANSDETVFRLYSKSSTSFTIRGKNKATYNAYVIFYWVAIGS